MAEIPMKEIDFTHNEAYIKRIKQKIKQEESNVNTAKAEIRRLRDHLEKYQSFLAFDPNNKKNIQIKEVEVKVPVDNPDTINQLATVNLELQATKAELSKITERYTVAATALKNQETAIKKAEKEAKGEFDKIVKRLNEDNDALTKRLTEESQKLEAITAENEKLRATVIKLSTIEEKTPEET